MSEDSKTVFKLVAGALCVSAVLVSVPLLAVPALIGFWIWRSVKKRRSRPSKKELAAAAREVGSTSGGADGSAWSYSCSRFELAIDFDRDQAVLRSRDPKARAETRLNAPVEALFEQAFQASDIWLSSDGQYGRIHISWSEREASFFGVESVWEGDAILHLGSAEMTVIDPRRANFSATFDGIPAVLNADLGQRWEPIEKRLRNMVYARAAAALAERRSRHDQALLNQKEAAAANAMRAKARLDEIKARAGLGAAFEDFGVGEKGALAWGIATDKLGNAVVEAGGESWSGSFAGARAKASIIEAAPASGAIGAVLELELELADKEYEREHLAKRRFKLMRGWTRDRLRAWTDRIELLAAADGKAASIEGRDERAEERA